MHCSPVEGIDWDTLGFGLDHVGKVLLCQKRPPIL